MGPIRNNARNKLVSDINVTPLVDVMLVLLIIFMVTAPMMTQGVDIDLPETTSKPLPQKENPIVVRIYKEGKIKFGGFEVSQKMLKETLMKKAKNGGTDVLIFLEADKSVPYGLVISVMADIKEAGFDKLGMVTQPRDN
jgi:biopolymer transport protein TolR